jgi:adenosylmethionine-8-amino-7-oxononanoate aminotransferase
MTDQPVVIWKRADGCFAWEYGNEDMQDALATICEDLLGHSNEEIAAAINAYLARLHAEHRARLN